MKKKYLIVSLLAAAAACVFAGCAAKEATGAELDKLGNFGFENSAHENGYLDLKLDDGFKVDGVLDEGVWENNGTAWTFAHANSTEENPVTMTSMSYLGEKGVYLALSVKDTAIYYSPDRRASGNTSVEVYIGAFDATEWNGDSYRLSVVPTGSDSCITELRTYRTKSAALDDNGSKLNAEWALWYKAHLAACRINGVGINSSYNEGYDIELFIPYESLGIEEKPQAIQYMTAFYHVESEASDADNVWTKCDPNVGATNLGGWLVATDDAIGLYADMADGINVRPDDYMTIDGSLDEDVYKKEKALVYRVNNSAYGVNASVATTAHISPRGVYLGIQIRDKQIYASPARNVKFNSGVEIWIQDSANTHVSTNSVQLRIDALGVVNKWRGTGRSDNGFSEKYFPSLSAVKLLGCQIDEGYIAADAATGFDVEIFVPYASLGFEAKPDDISVYPAYVHAGDNENTVNQTSASWIYFQPASQSAAKNDSQKAFLRLLDGDFAGKLVAADVLFNKGDLQADGSYEGEISVTKMPETELSGGKTDGAPVTDASLSAEGVALTHKGGGAYTLKIEKDYVVSFAEGKSVSVLSGGFRTEIQVLYISVAFDGRAEQSDGYSPAFSFLTTDSQSQNNEATVHVKSTATGVAFAIVMASPYINQTGSASGQNGGGLEIRMANSPDASTGLWWRVFSDGTARQETNLNAGAPSAERYASPVGSSAFAVGLVPNDENDLTKGYKQMTLEFFVSYGALDADGADDFYIAVGLNGTRKSDNAILAVRWQDNTGATKPASENWFSVSAMESYSLVDQSVAASNGEARFRIYADLSSHTYVKGASFIDGAVTEAGYGYYIFATNEGGTLEASVADRVVRITVAYEGPAVMHGTRFDGIVDENDAAYSAPFSFLTLDSQSQNNEVTVYTNVAKDGVGFALVMASPYINQTGSASGQNGGGLEIRMANSPDASTGLWWRVFSDGTARQETNLNAGAPSAERYASPVGSSAFAVGLVPNDENDLTKGYKQMTLEFFVAYSAVNAADAAHFYIAVGANGTKADNTTLAVRWPDNTGTTKPAAGNWTSAAAAADFALQDVNAVSESGTARFKLIAAFSEYAYVKGAVFTGGAVTEGDYGAYAFETETAATLTALWNGKTATVSVSLPSEASPVLDGVVSENEYTGYFSFTTSMGKDSADYAAIKVYYYAGKTAAYLAFDVTENTPAYVKNTGSGNQGTAGIDFAVATADLSRADYYRAYASGAVRSQAFNGNTFGAPGTYSAAVDFMKGSHIIERGGAQLDHITHYVLEWRIDCAAYGAESAADLHFMLGWINASMGDRAYGKASGMFGVSTNNASNGLYKIAEYYTLSDLAAG